MEKKALLSTIWIFAVLNYLYCDVLSLMDPSLLSQYLAGTVNGMKLDQAFLFAAGVLMEISISMVLLSRLLPYRINRWANVVAGSITSLVQIGTLFVGPSYYYIFFSVFEVGATLSIVIIAFRWKDEASIKQ